MGPYSGSHSSWKGKTKFPVCLSTVGFVSPYHTGGKGGLFPHGAIYRGLYFSWKLAYFPFLLKQKKEEDVFQSFLILRQCSFIKLSLLSTVCFVPRYHPVRKDKDYFSMGLYTRSYSSWKNKFSNFHFLLKQKRCVSKHTSYNAIKTPRCSDFQTSFDLICAYLQLHLYTGEHGYDRLNGTRKIGIHMTNT